jgi:hypothetical protein
LATVISDPALYKLLTFHIPKRMSLFCFLKHDTSSKNNPPPPRDPSGGVVYLRILSPEEASRPWVCLNKIFYGEELLAPRPTPKLEGFFATATYNLYPSPSYLPRQFRHSHMGCYYVLCRALSNLPQVYFHVIHVSSRVTKSEILMLKYLNFFGRYWLKINLPLKETIAKSIGRFLEGL